MYAYLSYEVITVFSTKLYLPNDIEVLDKKARIKQKIRLYLCIILFIIAVAFVIIMRNRLFKSSNIGFGIFITVVILYLPFILTDIPARLKDFTYCGTIEDVTVKAAKASDKSNARRLVDVNHIYLHIKAPDGKLFTHKAFSVSPYSVSFSHIQRVYVPGEKVFHICGSEFVTILPTKDDKTLPCPVCADQNVITNHICRGCGHTLIKEMPTKPLSQYAHINPRF
ncbi:MAG: hypothetical protein J6V93_00975 [Clostridia bacterium]|nr:hypothetical protein [Clostridia bacterium]